jgi:hypothetical protein
MPTAAVARCDPWFMVARLWLRRRDCWLSLETIQQCILDLFYLITGETPAHDVATHAKGLPILANFISISLNYS